jgi:hypothetical protein
MSKFSLFKEGGSDQEQVQRPPSQQLIDQITHAITEATEPKFLTYECIDPETGSFVVNSLIESEEVERAKPR